MLLPWILGFSVLGSLGTIALLHLGR